METWLVGMILLSLTMTFLPELFQWITHISQTFCCLIPRSGEDPLIVLPV